VKDQQQADIASVDDLERRLRQQFAVVSERISCAGRVFNVLRPRSADELVSEDEFKVDERLPYWAEIWPSARVLAEQLAGEPGHGRTLLELGCGCGYVALVAGYLGFKVLATDYYEPACDFVTLNAARHEMSNITPALVNWRDLPDLGKFDMVVAADVLYEREYCKLVAGVIARTLSYHGKSIVTDPSRRRAASFLEECAAVGLAGERIVQVPYDDSALKTTVDVYQLSWK
jgi:predicted nicotinamide N-methyase